MRRALQLQKAFNRSRRDQPRKIQRQQSSYLIGSPQQPKYKYAGTILLLTMTEVLARCADYLMTGYNIGMMI